MEGAWKPKRRLQLDVHRRGLVKPGDKAMPILAERYQLADLVYSDAWVVAYRARDRLLNRNVTVELLRPERAEAGNDERLLAKGRRAALTSLPNVAAIYDQGSVDGRPFLVLEEPLGPALADSVPLETGPAVALVESLAAIQRSAMRRRQTIPALTPWTIRLSGDGRVQVMDLGLDQEPPTDDAAVRQLGRVLEAALGADSAETELLGIAARAAGGSIATLDELLDELRNVRHAPKITEIMPREEPGARKTSATRAYPTPVHTKALRPYPASRPYAPNDAPTAAVRRPPNGGRGGGIVLAGALAVALLVAIGAAIASGRPEQAASSSAAPAASQPNIPAPAASAPAIASAAQATSQPSAASTAPAFDTYVVDAIGDPPQLRLRDGPGTNFRRIGALPNGTVVQVIEGPVPGGQYTWVRVRAGEAEGWCILEGLRRNGE